MKKPLREFVRLLKRNDIQVQSISSNKHYKIIADGKVITFSCSPSCSRHHKNLLAQLRRRFGR